MEARVLVAFRDREHMEDTYQPGDTFTGAAGRVRDLEARGFVEAVKPAPRKRAGRKTGPEPKE